jgi:biopolymer transport protein ExbB
MSTGKTVLRGIALVALLACWSQSASAWWNAEWSYRKEITLTPSAAALPAGAPLAPAVVLVRLHEGVFAFAGANADGSDLRFVAEDDKTPLAYHIEKFDPVFNLGFVWVSVPQLKTDGPTKIWMYSGSEQATTLPAARESYDSNQLLVYHFSDASGSAPQDATNYAHHGGGVSVIDDAGLIGGAARFDGSGVLTLPAAPSLQMQAGNAMSWSLWLKPLSAETSTVYDYGAGQFSIGLEGGRPRVRLGGSAPLLAPTPIADGNWHHLGIVASAAGTLSLYVDGQLAGTAPGALPTAQASATLGGAGGSAAIREAYHGSLDELQIYKGELGAAWMLLTAANQGTADKLLSFGGDEEQSSAHTSHMGIILASLTLDAWIAIGVLMVMMLASFAIMYNKARQLNRAVRGNEAFLDLLEKAEGDVLTLYGTLPAKAGDDRQLQAALDSPLHALFDSGLREIRHRNPSLSEDYVLNAASVEAIRAAMETVVVRQTQSLNKLMVLLTIAISGGPFIGLLGTVMGVMITFAAVAAAGDVNVNAIAPGIAAALAATVAGLMVAIPSLFGYNYLLTRVKECGAEMQVFVQEFTTKIAERFHTA